jgi:hypothetical protein
MQADHVEVSRDEENKHWLIRIQVGEEVIRRHRADLDDADDATLLAAAQQTVVDEGYTIEPAAIVIARPA